LFCLNCSNKLLTGVPLPCLLADFLQSIILDTLPRVSCTVTWWTRCSSVGWSIPNRCYRMFNPLKSECKMQYVCMLLCIIFQRKRREIPPCFAYCNKQRIFHIQDKAQAHGYSIWGPLWQSFLVTYLIHMRLFFPSESKPWASRSGHKTASSHPFASPWGSGSHISSCINPAVSALSLLLTRQAVL
jgi:hypothetical protein